MKLRDLQENLRLVPADLAAHRVYYGTALLAVILGMTTWFVWEAKGDHVLVPPPSLIAAGILILINLVLSYWALRREAYASYLLIGATLLGEIVVMYFLYRV